ncbi:MAG: hypothetical protein WCF19_03820 [Chlamydiales bacterium]
MPFGMYWPNGPLHRPHTIPLSVYTGYHQGSQTSTHLEYQIQLEIVDHQKA